MSEAVVQNKKEPVLAAIGSFIIPGCGQIYNGDGLLKGILILLGTTIGALFFIIPGLLIWLYGIYDAYSVAKKVNSGKAPFKEFNGLHFISFIVIAAVWLIVWLVITTIILAAVIAAFVFGTGTATERHYIVSMSMYRMADGRVVITNDGGRDENLMENVKISFVDAGGVVRGPDTVENLAGYGVTGSLDSTGSSCTITSNSIANPSHVVVFGTFSGGNVQILSTADI